MQKKGRRDTLHLGISPELRGLIDRGGLNSKARTGPISC